MRRRVGKKWIEPPKLIYTGTKWVSPEAFKKITPDRVGSIDKLSKEYKIAKELNESVGRKNKKDNNTLKINKEKEKEKEKVVVKNNKVVKENNNVVKENNKVVKENNNEKKVVKENNNEKKVVKENNNVVKENNKVVDTNEKKVVEKNDKLKIKKSSAKKESRWVRNPKTRTLVLRTSQKGKQLLKIKARQDALNKKRFGDKKKKKQ